MTDATAVNDVPDAPDTGAEDTVDTSTNEETPDTDDDTSLEDMGISDDEIDDDTEETKESDDDSPASDDSDETEEESKEDDAPTEDKSEVDEEAERKRLNDEYAKRRIAEREAREQAKQQAQMEYLKAAEDEKDLALRQLQVQAYNQRVEFNTNKLETGLDKAVAVIPELRDGSPEVKEFLLDAVDEFERLYVVRDQDGEPLEVTGDITEYLTKKADSARRLAGLGARKQAKAKGDAKSRTMTPPSKAPKEAKTDSDLEDFDKGWND